MSLAQQEFDRREKEFLAHLKQIYHDLRETISTIRNSKNGDSLMKSELCLAFIGADTFSRIYKLFCGAKEEELDNKIEARFKNWFSEFVLTNKNDVYKNHKTEISCDAELAWEIRNSLVHFYGLPDREKCSDKLGFVCGDIKGLADFKKKFKDRGISIKLIHSHYFIEAILQGFLGQLLSMKEMVKNNQSEYIDRVILAHKIIMNEGSVSVRKNQNRTDFI